MKIKPFTFCFLFLLLQGAVFLGVNQVNIQPIMDSINAPPPENPELDVPWSQGGLFASVANAVGWLGQILLWAGSKAGGYMTIIYVLIAPSIEWGSLLSFVTIINIVMVLIMFASILPDSVL